MSRMDQKAATPNTAADTESGQQLSSPNMSTPASPMLESIISGLIEARADAPEPYKPMLISNRRGGRTMHTEISEALNNSNSFDISVAFVSADAVLSLLEDFRTHHANASQQQRNRLITSTKGYFNDPSAFRQLLHLHDIADVDVRIWKGSDASSTTTQGQPFHPKGYVFARQMRNGTPYYELFVGSSNFTSAALNTQREWNLKVSSLADGELVKEVQNEIDSQINDSIPLTEEWIKQYEEDFKKYAPPRREILASLEGQEIKPNAMQQEALENLKKLRQQGEHRAVIISATGTGKTYLSAFDVRECKPRRMLYIAQQEMILKAAMKSYQKVLGCAKSELGLYSGSSKQQDRRYVFATVQTLSKAKSLAQFSSDAFDYILVDEVHHAGAESYRRVIEHFKDADFMLGMTATPERTDGFNIFDLFDHNIAYEIRLQRALDENMLCPFHYYGVAEYLGSDDDPDRGMHRIDVSQGLTAKDSAQLKYEIEQLATEQRVRYIIDKLQEYGQAGLHVTGLVFCSRQEEARELSRLFNQHFNQQAERNYRTAAITSTDAEGKSISQEQRNEYVQQLTNEELDYLFTVDMFNEGIDIPAVNQIVMLRSTESSIVFTQQLGRGLRKFPHKESVVVIDFIGNYNNNYLIPVALYGNTGDRDRARKNLQRKSIGLSSISFDPIAKERVLKSLDTANWSEMQKLLAEYKRVRFELGRIPLLTDIYTYDPSLPCTMAEQSKQLPNYLAFVQNCEKRIGRGKDRQPTFLDQLDPVTSYEDSLLKMATSVLLPGLRPQELVILEQLCSFNEERPETTPTDWHASESLSRTALFNAIRSEFPQADCSDAQFDSAISVLNYSYFGKNNHDRYGGSPLIEEIHKHDTSEDTMQIHYKLSERFATTLARNRTFRIFFADTLRVGLINCRDMFLEAASAQRTIDYAFIYEHKYTIWDVMRLCGWKKENNPQNVGGYQYDKETNTMPILVKYAASQYEDEFLNPQEMKYFSKNNRNPQSPEFKWAMSNLGPNWDHTHFVPLFVMRKAEADDKRYYYVGHVVDFGHPQLTTKPDASGQGKVNVTISTLRLARPIDPELYRHLVS